MRMLKTALILLLFIVFVAVAGGLFPQAWLRNIWFDIFVAVPCFLLAILLGPISTIFRLFRKQPSSAPTSDPRESRKP